MLSIGYQTSTTKLNIIFKTYEGEQYNTSFYKGTKVNQVLLEYLIKTGRSALLQLIHIKYGLS